MTADVYICRCCSTNGFQRCEISHEVLDDVVGPMVNRRVVVQGYWNRQRRFRLVDIEIDVSEPGQQPDVEPGPSS